MFYREKGFYISLICGIVCLAVFGAICFNIFSDEETEQSEVASIVTPRPTQTATPQPTEPMKEEEHVETTIAPTKAPKTNEVIKNTPAEEKLHFDQETGLLWPIEGDVIIDYSDEKVVYFPTLAQYKTNPAMIIGSKEGEPVKASMSGIVKQIYQDDELGKCMTLSIGNGFKLVYGQLKDVTVAKGDEVTEGQVIAKIAKPTKYFSVEGANLYFQVLQKNKPVNPMVLLR